MVKVVRLLTFTLILNVFVQHSYADDKQYFLFEDVIRESGLQRTGPSFSAAAADYDLDGFVDVIISNHKAKDHDRVELYHNNGKGAFSIVPLVDASRGDIDPHGISWLDFNSDGWLDLYISCGANRGMGYGDNLIYLNHHNGFEFKYYGDLLADLSGGSRSSAPWDFDNDGRIDLVMMNHFRPGRGQHIAVQREDMFVDFAEKVGWQARQAESVRIVYLDDSQNPYFIIQTGGAEAGSIFSENDQGALADVSARLGVTSGGNVQSVLPLDFDNDGDLDLYYVLGPNWVSALPEVDGAKLSFFYGGDRDVLQGFRVRVEGKIEVNTMINGEVHPEYVKLGKEKKTIRNIPFVIDTNDPGLNGKPEIDSVNDLGVYLWKDSNGDIQLWFVGKEGTFFSAATGSITCLDAKPPVLLETIGEATRLSDKDFVNKLFENKNGHFVDVTEKSGVGDNGLGSDAISADFDNDGYLDLYVINGGNPYHNSPGVMYKNNGDGTFENITAKSKTEGVVTGRSDTALAFDYDNDGDLDMLLLNGNGPPPVSDEGTRILWRNDSKQGNWLDVELRGAVTNLWGMGARVVVRQGGGRKLMQQRQSTTTRFATSILPLHFGLGDQKETEIVVVWPSGRMSKKRVRSNQKIMICEPEK